MKSTALCRTIVAASATLLGTVAALTLTTAPAFADTSTQEPAAAQESAGQMVDDTAITSKVKSAFVQDEKVDALSIHVTTDKGVVQLSGFANSVQEASRAAELARGVPGVKDVKNDIELKR